MASKFSFCENEVKKNDYERYLCCLLANQDVRHRLFAIYAFNNEIAKIKYIIKEPMVGHIRLQWWRDAVDEIYQHRPIKHRHEVVEALYEVICETDIPKELFDNLIDAREADIEFESPENMASLTNYAVGTSSNLFYILMAAAEIKSHLAKEAAYYAGISYAITGVVRSMKYNSYHGTVVFPKELMQEEGLTTEDVVQGKNLEKTKPITKLLCEDAKINLHHTRELLSSIPKEAKDILLPVCMVETFLKRIRKNDYDLFNNDIEGNILSLQLRIYFSKLLGRL